MLWTAPTVRHRHRVVASKRPFEGGFSFANFFSRRPRGVCVRRVSGAEIRTKRAIRRAFTHETFERTRIPMNAADVMTPDPVCISPEASITDAIRLMLERKFSGLPVVDAGGCLVGIVTEGDLLRRTETGTQRKRPRWIEFLMGPGRLATEYVQTAGRKVNDVMTAEVRTVTEDAPLDEIVHLMEHHQIKRALVVRDSKLVGIVPAPIYCTRWRALPPRRSPGRPVTRPFASGSMRNSTASGGLQSASLTSWCATESCTFRARCSMSGSAGRSAWPRNVFPGSRPSKITLCGSTPCPGWSYRHEKSPRRRESPLTFG